MRLRRNITRRDTQGLTASRHLRLVFTLAMALAPVCAAQSNTAPSDNAAPAQSATGAQGTIDCKEFSAGDPNLELISELCVFALTYRDKLPDFIAQQTTT
jgi:hypothetical protein